MKWQNEDGDMVDIKVCNNCNDAVLFKNGICSKCGSVRSHSTPTTPEAIPEEISTETLACTCGKKSGELDGNESTGKKRDKTGFGFAPTLEGEIIWLCPDCYKKVHELATSIHGIVKNEFLYFSALLRPPSATP